MTWEVVWHSKAAKYVEDLPNDTSKRVFDKIEEVVKDPFRYLEHSQGEPYKLRIGDYRALIDVDFQGKKLKVLHFDKRGRVYS